jgi:hypothetical protein
MVVSETTGGRQMSEPEHGGRVLLGNVVRLFLDGGGTLRYKPVRAKGGKTHWLVFGVRADGTEAQVFVSGKGSEKRFRSADAVVRYHQSMCPDATEVCIPVIPLHDGSGGDEQDEEQE